MEKEINIKFKLSLTPADAGFVADRLPEGTTPVFDSTGNQLAKVEIGGQAFNLLLSKTSTWEPTPT
jgi:hypothetical protein